MSQKCLLYLLQEKGEFDMKNMDKFLSLLDGEVDGLLLTSRFSRHYCA